MAFPVQKGPQRDGSGVSLSYWYYARLLHPPYFAGGERETRRSTSTST